MGKNAHKQFKTAKHYNYVCIIPSYVLQHSILYFPDVDFTEHCIPDIFIFTIFPYLADGFISLLH